MSIQGSPIKTVETNDDALEFPLRLSKTCLLSIRNDNAFISPIAIETAFHALLYTDKKLINKLNKTYPFDFYNYFIIDKNFTESISNEETKKYFNTEFQVHSLTDSDEKKMILNEILKDFSEQRSVVPIILSQKSLGQIIIEPMTLLSCISFTFRPYKSEYWEQLWSLKFHSNINLSIETEFYFTKGLFRVAFHDTFHKIEIPGQNIQMKLIILLPRCSSDLVHLYANIKEYLNLPYSSAYIGVCIPKISMDIDINLIESLKELNEEFHLSAAYSLGHFSIDMSANQTEASLSPCSHSIDLSPVTPWVFFANRPFLFLITYDNYYLFIGQMLSPKIPTNKYFSKSKHPTRS